MKLNPFCGQREQMSAPQDGGCLFAVLRRQGSEIPCRCFASAGQKNALSLFCVGVRLVKIKRTDHGHLRPPQTAAEELQNTIWEQNTV